MSGSATVSAKPRRSAWFQPITSDPTDAVRAESLTAGAMACLAKPVEAGILLDFLRSRTTGLAAQDHPSAVHATEIRDVDDMDAGRTGQMTVSLRPGTYMLVCNAPGHYAAGQHITFNVTKS